MDDLTYTMQKVSGKPLEFNCCNVNKYDGGYHSVGIHKDDEKLFRNPHGYDIISLSIGASRRFDLRKDFTGKVTKVYLNDGDLVWMAGKCQQYYSHAIPEDLDACGTRFIFTWRIITHHDRRCKSLIGS